MNLAILKFLLAVGQLVDGLIDAVITSEQFKDELELQAAIREARSAKSREAKIEAARKINSSFRHHRK